MKIGVDFCGQFLVVLASHSETPLVQNVEQAATPLYYHNPNWSPDGLSITFYSNEDEDFNNYWVTTDGADLQRLTDEKTGN